MLELPLFIQIICEIRTLSIVGYVKIIEDKLSNHMHG